MQATDAEPIHVPDSSALGQALQAFAYWQQQADAVNVSLRQPPTPPTTCCGRGCNGCVWEGFFGAATFWVEDAQTAVTEATHLTAS